MHSLNKPPQQCDVAIIGGGPSGLAAATELKKLGVESVIVLERESEAGGIPRHCGHSPFGIREFKRIYSGKKYTSELVKQASELMLKSGGGAICLNTTVTAIRKGGLLELSTPEGVQNLKARKVIVCTGIRETPRATRLVSGQRPMGIMTTGALQSMIYLKNKKPPFKRPVIIGTELVSFSAIMSCRHAGIRPVAMLEENSRISAKSGTQLIAKGTRVPVLYNTRLQTILGKQKVEGVEILTDTDECRTLDCDGVIFTGKFVAESSLMRVSHLEIDRATGNPLIDQFGRCTDPDYFATGNMTHPVETAGYCWSDGKQVAQQVFASLNGLLDGYNQYIKIISKQKKIKYFVPQMLAISNNGPTQKGMDKLQLRVKKAVKGRLSLSSDDKMLAHKVINALPERRIVLAIPELENLNIDGDLRLNLEG